MVRRNLTIPHRIACVTDIPSGIDSAVDIIAPPRDFEDVRIPTWGESRPQCLRRLAMFAPDAGAIFGERIVCMDLDCVVSQSLDPLFAGDEDFRICRGTTRDRPYNGSLFMLRAGARPQAYTRFTPEAAAAAGRDFLGSDQAWLSKVLPREKTWGDEDGVYFWDAIGQACTAVSRVTFFPGTPKPHDLVERGFPEWVGQHYRAQPTGRCLVIGNADGVWDEVAKALKTKRFDRVIVSPQVAQHWDGPVVEAKDDETADRLVAMLGYEDVTYCGRGGSS
ncbi:hypothetical protein [EBPR siphovirus 3]|nr:hypothetical protein [EBPR siphovirus 3]